ncbi:maleylpyruvate isomerase family mycothiol-dependent enzyme [Kitasatospora sp. YST-16]|uniref:maleylpyruvate isomerase family mycothiol-dependent enzyme n=1 Tax=Kitasatospora sp. YST-16 TaxID=2998080 RepID=UPI0022849AD9|nr:maleylpyruvate isomerase family mycothiol-dependent enzyme [Kitasatospora sp. YST-16]WAL75884.1 maleylpyruvate isomerase family mycothiol-dependent enzyme [Kitasatospora sp. YST-16]WNW41945.1 maleylpyruvate isomerase family mycothiol-dependent enzyme [Streptomyces sp. Li-HN-5-13]
MSGRTLADARGWAALGTRLFLAAAEGFGPAEYAAPTPLPGWSRAHLAAHLAANADALGNLVHWAATGEPTPMYASPEERLAGIERGRALPAAELTSWVRESAQRLTAGLDALTPEQWQAPVTTAQGRTVPAAELPWLRAREACVHAVDLAAGTAFADLPAGFLAALCTDVLAKRAPAFALRTPDGGVRWNPPGDGEQPVLEAELPQLTAYLTGRQHIEGAPPLDPWL